MNRALTCFLLAGALALYGAGCDGDSPGDGDAGSDGMDAGGAADGGESDGDSGDVDPTDDGGGGGGDDAGPGIDASDSTDGGGVDPDGGSGMTDAGPTGVDCMGMICEGSTPFCCVTAGGTGAMASCVATADMCAGVPLTCDGPEDCASGEQCCVTLGGVGGTSGGARCVAGACPGTSRVACHAADECPAGDGRMLMCCPFMIGGFSGSVCQPRCSDIRP